MSSHFSANQYEDAFDSKRLQNWQLPKTYKERPSPYEGCTDIIANDRGHLLEDATHSAESPWGNFVGTWDMPKKIPGNVTTTMARSKSAAKDLHRSKQEHDTLMRQAAGSPAKEPCKEKTSPAKSLEPRPVNPSPLLPQEKPPSKSPTQNTPGAPQPSAEKPIMTTARKSPAQNTPRTPRPSPEETSAATAQKSPTENMPRAPQPSPEDANIATVQKSPTENTPGTPKPENTHTAATQNALGLS